MAAWTQVPFAEVEVGDGRPVFWGPGGALLSGPVLCIGPQLAWKGRAFLWLVRARRPGEAMSTVP